MTGREHDDPLEGLYEDLKKFAPPDAVDEMAELAERLRQLEPEAGGPVKLPNFDDMWERVELQLDDRSDSDESA